MFQQVEYAIKWIGSNESITLNIINNDVNLSETPNALII